MRNVFAAVLCAGTVLAGSTTGWAGQAPRRHQLPIFPSAITIASTRPSNFPTRYR